MKYYGTREITWMERRMSAERPFDKRWRSLGVLWIVEIVKFIEILENTIIITEYIDTYVHISHI